MKNFFAQPTPQSDGLSLLTRGDFAKQPAAPTEPSGVKAGKSALKMARDFAQGTARGVASVGLSVINPIVKAFGQKPIELKPEDYTKYPKAIFGDQGVQDLSTRSTRFKAEHKTLAGPGGILAAPIVLGSTALDLTGFGGAKVGREALELALKEAKTAEETFSILKKAGIADDIATKYAPRFAAETDAKIIKEGVDSLENLIGSSKKVFRATGGELEGGGSRANLYGSGAYASEKKEVAESFLKKGGKIVELDPLKNPLDLSGLSQEEVMKRARAAGYSAVDETYRGAADFLRDAGGFDGIKIDDFHIFKELPDAATTGRRLLNAERLAVTPQARKIVVDAVESIRPELETMKGGALTHEEVLKAAGDSEVLQQATTRAETLKREAELLRLRQSISAMAESETVTKEFVESLKTASNEATSLGRQLNALKMDASPELVTNKEYLIKELAKLGVETDKIVEASKGVNFDNVAEATEFYRTFVKPSLGEVIDEYRYINLLSSPRTHIINSFTNVLQTVGLRPLTKLVSGLVDTVASTLTGKQREVYLREVPAYYRGVLNSVQEAAGNFAKAFRGEITGYRPDIERIPTGVKALKPFQVIPRLLEASDQFFNTLIKAGERESITERFLKQGRELDAKALAEIDGKSTQTAAEYTFRKALDGSNKTGQGKLLSAIDKFTAGVYQLRKAPGVKWFIPFVQTPMNILKQGIEYSPLGLTTLPGAVNKTEQIAKSIIGSTVMAGAGALALNGRTTWSAPTGDKEKQAFYASGRKAYSVKIGDNWVSYTKLGPLAYPIAMASAVQWFFNESPKSATEANEKKLLNVLGGIGQFFSDQSYVQGMNNLLQAISGDVQGMKNAVTMAPGQLIPLASLQRWVAQLVDPVYRKGSNDFTLKDIVDNLKKGIPYASKTLEPERDPAGRPSEVQHPGLRAFTPFDVGTEVPKYERQLQVIRRDQRLRAIKKQRTESKKSKGGMVNYFQ